MKEIVEFLNLKGSLNYQAGIALLKKYANNDSLIAYFSKNPQNSFNESYLRSSLIKLISAAPKAEELDKKNPEKNIVAPALSIGPSLSESKQPRIAFENLSESLQKEYLRRNDLVRQCDILKERIRNNSSRTERYDLALLLLRNWNEVRAIWKKLDDYSTGNNEANEALPDLSGFTLIELKDLKQKQMVCRSKAKSKGNTTKFNYHEKLIRHINERINVQIQ